MHNVRPQDGVESTQFWLRSDSAWKAISIGHQITDITGKSRTLVVNPEGEPAWVLKGTAQKNYGAKKRKVRKKFTCVQYYFRLILNT